MSTCYYQFNPKINKNGSYDVTYSVCDDVTRGCIVREEYEYRPNTPILHNNDLRNKISNAILMRLKVRGTRPNSYKCLNPKTDFLSRAELCRLAKEKRQKAAEPKPETPAKDPLPSVIPTNKKEYELRRIIDQHGNEHWTIVKTSLKVFTEQEAKEELFKIQLEALNG